MPQPVVRTTAPATEELQAGFARIRSAQKVPVAFPSEVEAEAIAAAAAGPAERPRADRTALELVTLDPLGATDLDQAVHLEPRRGGGWRVRYAIADLGAFVAPGGAVDAEARRRGVTFYSPDQRTPLHPTALSEDAASLLAGKDRPALLWSFELDADGAIDPAATSLEPAWVRSRAALDYATVQAQLDAGTADEPMVLLRQVGLAREHQERLRGAVSLPLAEQLVERDAEGHYQLAYRWPLPVEGWNAQISLLTGIEAARLMLDAQVGILRTLPPPDPALVDAVRRSARVLGFDVPPTMSYPDLIHAVDPTTARGAALLHQAARSLRGAGYVAFDGTVPALVEHGAVASSYAHVTAPLRRLVDRFANEALLAVVRGDRPPRWVLDSLGDLPKAMGSANNRERAVSRAIVDFVEAAVLQWRVGETFPAAVTAVDERGAVIQIADPAVLARMNGAAGEGLVPGTDITVGLDAVDLEAGTVTFTVR